MKNKILCLIVVFSACIPVLGSKSGSLSFKVDKQFLCIPLSVDETVEESDVTVRVDGENLFIEPMHFTEKGPQWWSNLDVSEHLEKWLTVDGVPEYAVKKIKLSDTIFGHPNLYHEANRPQIHFSFRHGGLGDPTAKFYYAPNDEWHLFYIQNLYRGYALSWGHAVSKDLIHWEERAPIFEYNSKIFNGVGIVDTRNDFGLNMNGHQAIILLQTHRDRPGGSFSYVPCVDGKLKLDILVDVTSLEIYANDGAVYVPYSRLRFYEKEEGDIKFFANDGTVAVESLEVIELQSIWK